MPSIGANDTTAANGSNLEECPQAPDHHTRERGLGEVAPGRLHGAPGEQEAMVDRCLLLIAHHDEAFNKFASRTTTQAPLACLRRMDRALPDLDTALPPDNGTMRTSSSVQQYARSPET